MHSFRSTEPPSRYFAVIPSSSVTDANFPLDHIVGSLSLPAISTHICLLMYFPINIQYSSRWLSWTQNLPCLLEMYDIHNTSKWLMYSHGLSAATRSNLSIKTWISWASIVAVFLFHHDLMFRSERYWLVHILDVRWKKLYSGTRHYHIEANISLKLNYPKLWNEDNLSSHRLKYLLEVFWSFFWSVSSANQSFLFRLDSNELNGQFSKSYNVFEIESDWTWP